VAAQGSQKGQDAEAAQWGPRPRNRADDDVRRSGDGAVRTRDEELSEASAQWGWGAVAQSTDKNCSASIGKLERLKCILMQIALLAFLK
jgi:hypothetical protein